MMQSFRRHPVFSGIYKAVSGSSYNYDREYVYLFNSAYMRNDDLCEKGVNNGK